ncbi:uncharacterized protein DSM5745_09922 [Aspergillus mulundensis]|uniref:Uncharacterized protein n=1 Tax=Aspergillus mulundensis TaxID=1810919 RepID=A0A3D8QS48_9EURO|nr:hypothetical protein DSM5745_09922 [Aspergillus mulundensis]RDW64511.1 hypothetical protein DSM5745_09922 [Aspergillus mulundensis]
MHLTKALSVAFLATLAVSAPVQVRTLDGQVEVRSAQTPKAGESVYDFEGSVVETTSGPNGSRDWLLRKNVEARDAQSFAKGSYAYRKKAGAGLDGRSAQNSSTGPGNTEPIGNEDSNSNGNGGGSSEPIGHGK